MVIVLALAMSQLTTYSWPKLSVLWASWLVGFGFPAPVQARILKEAAAAPNFASTLISTAFNIGIASGAAIGGAAIAAGWGYSILPLLDAGFLTLSLLATLLLVGFDRRQRVIAPTPGLNRRQFGSPSMPLRPRNST